GHYDRGVGVSRYDTWEYRGVSHPQVVESTNAQRGIDDGERVASDPTRARWMVHTYGARADIFHPARGVANPGPGQDFLAAQALECGCGQDSPCECDALHHEPHIIAVIQVIRIDQRR